ncbi:MAG: hypothetical protein ABSB61_07610 [Anaerolineales bacterium]|jgi:hypothetical protein
MAGRVFISCGQATEEERQAAATLREYFRERGFQPYVAIQAQSIQDVNTAIVSELKLADFYVFVDFGREELPGKHEGSRRGSLFAHQELAIAYLLGFEKVIFLQQKDVLLEGLLRYMASNASRFSSTTDVLPTVQCLVEERAWDPSYSRHLVVGGIHWSDGTIAFGSHTGERLVGRFLYLDILNMRTDLAAFNCIARLASISRPGVLPQISPDRSHLKVTGQPGFVQTIWPSSGGAFDLLMVKSQGGGAVYLNNALDVIPKRPILADPGEYRLHYEVLAEAFPILELAVDLHATGIPDTTQASLVLEPT